MFDSESKREVGCSQRSKSTRSGGLRTGAHGFFSEASVLLEVEEQLAPGNEIQHEKQLLLRLECEVHAHNERNITHACPRTHVLSTRLMPTRLRGVRSRTFRSARVCSTWLRATTLRFCRIFIAKS